MPPLLHTLHIEEGTLLLNSVSVCFPSLNITMFSRQDVFPCVAWLALPVSLQAQITNNTSFYWDEAEGTKYITHVSSPKPFVQISIFIIWYLFWLPSRRALEVFCFWDRRNLDIGQRQTTDVTPLMQDAVSYCCHTYISLFSTQFRSNIATHASPQRSQKQSNNSICAPFSTLYIDRDVTFLKSLTTNAQVKWRNPQT